MPQAARIETGVYAAIQDPTRRRILDLLATGEQSVHRLAEPFDMSRPAISQHLKVLKDAGLVSSRRLGRENLHRLEAAPLREVHDWVAHYERFWTDRLAALGRYLDREADREAARDERRSKRKKRPGRRPNVRKPPSKT